MRAKRASAGVVTIEGLELNWDIHREPQWCTADGWKGLSIAVRLAEGNGRELLIEYPIDRRADGRVHLPQRPKIDEKTLAAYIQMAVAAGWDPTSRGKTFAFQVP
jgi:hypothetical protein